MSLRIISFKQYIRIGSKNGIAVAYVQWHIDNGCESTSCCCFCCRFEALPFRAAWLADMDLFQFEKRKFSRISWIFVIRSSTLMQYSHVCRLNRALLPIRCNRKSMYQRKEWSCFCYILTTFKHWFSFSLIAYSFSHLNIVVRIQPFIDFRLIFQKFFNFAIISHRNGTTRNTASIENSIAHK